MGEIILCSPPPPPPRARTLCCWCWVCGIALLVWCVTNGRAGLSIEVVTENFLEKSVP